MVKEKGRLAGQVAALAVLDEPLRRQLYLYVGRHGPEVSRDQAAQALGISRALAAFHLDRLVRAGFLETTFRRLSGKGGPGAGRSSKLYTRVARQLEVTLPERRYELASRLMARALAKSRSGTAAAELSRAAREHGQQLGAEARARAGNRPGAERLTKEMLDTLHDAGYEPALTPEGTVVLHNCPFHALTAHHREMVCGMNLALFEGLADEVGIPGLSPRLQPAEGCCCVVMARRRTGA